MCTRERNHRAMGSARENALPSLGGCASFPISVLAMLSAPFPVPRSCARAHTHVHSKFPTVLDTCWACSQLPPPPRLTPAVACPSSSVQYADCITWQLAIHFSVLHWAVGPLEDRGSVFSSLGPQLPNTVPETSLSLNTCLMNELPAAWQL